MNIVYIYSVCQNTDYVDQLHFKLLSLQYVNYLDIVLLCLCAGDLGLRDFPPPPVTFFFVNACAGRWCRHSGVAHF